MSLTADELAHRIREDIQSGRMPTGTKLPSLNEFVETLGVGKGVAQQAIIKLRAEGLIASKQGAGNFIQDGFARTDLYRSDFGLVDDHGTDALARQVVTRVDEVPAPGFVAEHLGVDAGESVVTRQWIVVMQTKSAPVQLHDDYFPVDLARGSALLYHDFGPSGLIGRLAELGQDPDHVKESVAARPATGGEGDAMDLRVGSWVVEIKRMTYSKQRCVCVSRAVMDAQLYNFVYELDRKVS